MQYLEDMMSFNSHFAYKILSNVKSDNAIHFVKRNNRNINKSDKYGNTMLHYSCKKGEVNLVKLLVEHGALFKENYSGNTPLQFAILFGHFDLVKILVLEYKVDIDTNSIFTAVKHDFIDITVFLLKNNPNAINYHHYDFDGSSLLYFAVSEQMVKILLEYRININLKSVSGGTALHYSVATHNYQVTKILANYINLINSQDYNGLTPLHIAILCNDPEIVKLLLQSGSDINIRNEYNQTCRDLGRKCFSRKIRRLFLKTNYNSTFTYKYPTDNCAICLETFEHDQEIFELGCNHLFHESCFVACDTIKCPTCRTLI